MNPVPRRALVLALSSLALVSTVPASAVEAETDDFDVAPVPIRTVAPEYPESAEEAGATGRVMLRLLVDVEGRPAEIEVLEATEDHPELEEAAIEAARQWLFAPASKDGEPVAASVVLPIVFALDEDC